MLQEFWPCFSSHLCYTLTKTVHLPEFVFEDLPRCYRQVMMLVARYCPGGR